MPVPTTSMATRGPAVVDTKTPSAGPAMKLNSVVTESSANAGRRCDSGASAAMDWRVSEKTGRVRKPPIRAAASNAG
jgi:hypothetical protein